MIKRSKKYSVFSLVKNAMSYHENWQPAWRNPEIKKEYDAIIVGGGGHGLTTAYYLAKNHGIRNIAKEIYRADDVIADKKIMDQLTQFEEAGYGKFPICIAKTQYSFSTDPNNKGAPSNHSIPIREVRLSSGAEFIVVVCGEIMTMPGLPSVPAADSIRLNSQGEIEGLF